MGKTRNVLWIICCAAALLTATFGLTPLSIPKEGIHPKLFTLPYALWVSMLNSVVLLLLTVLGTFIHPGNRQE